MTAERPDFGHLLPSPGRQPFSTQASPFAGPFEQRKQLRGIESRRIYHGL